MGRKEGKRKPDIAKFRLDTDKLVVTMARDLGHV